MQMFANDELGKIKEGSRPRMKMTAFCDIAQYNSIEVDRRFREIALIEAIRISKTSVKFYETSRRNIPEAVIFIQAVMRTLKLTNYGLFHLGQLQQGIKKQRLGNGSWGYGGLDS
jgi:hypothetical protein